jgi:hypothetical protein
MHATVTIVLALATLGSATKKKKNDWGSFAQRVKQAFKSSSNLQNFAQSGHTKCYG